MFLEEVDYKMEIIEGSEDTNRVLVKKQEFTEQQQREAFKKKLRKYSGILKPQDYEELP